MSIDQLLQQHEISALVAHLKSDVPLSMELKLHLASKLQALIPDTVITTMHLIDFKMPISSQVNDDYIPLEFYNYPKTPPGNRVTSSLEDNFVSLLYFISLRLLKHCYLELNDTPTRFIDTSKLSTTIIVVHYWKPVGFG